MKKMSGDIALTYNILEFGWNRASGCETCAANRHRTTAVRDCNSSPSGELKMFKQNFVPFLEIGLRCKMANFVISVICNEANQGLLFAIHSHVERKGKRSVVTQFDQLAI
jgi:hypothetical protein